MIRPGEVYMAEFPEAGRHPVVVVSREELNRGHYVLAVFCTSSRFTVRNTLPNCVPYRAGQFGFTADCVAQCENILSIEKSATGPLQWPNWDVGYIEFEGCRQDNWVRHRSGLRAGLEHITAKCSGLVPCPRSPWACLSRENRCMATQA